MTSYYSKKKLQYRKFGITSLRASLEQLKNMHIVCMATFILPKKWLAKAKH